jgi:hypothetical protein
MLEFKGMFRNRFGLLWRTLKLSMEHGNINNPAVKALPLGKLLGATHVQIHATHFVTFWIMA